MQALEFWKAVTVDRSDFLERIIALLEKNHIRFCVVGGQAVNAYAEPVVSIDLDIAVAVEDFARAETLVRNVPPGDTLVRIRIENDLRYTSFPDHATQRNVLGVMLPVASIEDVMRGKIWAAQDPDRRGSKRQKDLADIARLLETHPHLRPLVPASILDRLF